MKKTTNASDHRGDGSRNGAEANGPLNTPDASGRVPEDTQHDPDIRDLLVELLTILRKVDHPDDPPTSTGAKLKRGFRSATEAVKYYWVWLPIIGFLLAWYIFRFNPFYIFDQYKIASDESAAKVAAIDHRERVLHYYLELGNTLLNAGKGKDAAKAFEEAKKIVPTNLEAEYGLRKTSLLAFSEEKQFDPVVAAARFAQIETLAPMIKAGVPENDPHVQYAKTLFRWRTDRSETNTAEVIELLKSVQAAAPEHSAAPALLGEIVLAESDLKTADIDTAIDYLEKARRLSPHQWEITNNLAYAYQVRANDHLHRGEHEKGLKTLEEQAYPLYVRTIALDRELISPRIEVTRLQALFNMPKGHVNLKVGNLIAQIESDQLHVMEKNKTELFYRLVDKTDGGHQAAVYSWEAKKAYLHQLQWMADYFDPARQVEDEAVMQAELAKIQNAAIDGKINLPWFMVNDLDTLKRYHPDWANKTGVAEKIALLFSVSKGQRTH